MAGILLAFVLFTSMSPSGRTFINNWKHSMSENEGVCIVIKARFYKEGGIRNDRTR